MTREWNYGDSKYETLVIDDLSFGYRITLNRPQVRNAINQTMVEELTNFMSGIEQDEQVRVLVIQGAGGHFCAGGDLGDMLKAAQDFEQGNPDAFKALNLSYGRLLVQFARLPCTTIALLEGTVMGGGLGFAAVADISLCSASSKLAMPEVSLGLPPAQIAPFVAERIGLNQTRRLALTARKLLAAEALTLGLVDQVAEDSEALGQLLQTELHAIQTCSPKAVRATKKLLVNLSRLGEAKHAELEQQLLEAAEAFNFAVTRGDGPEGTSAFIEKRHPVWVTSHKH
ncbi:enoyl-CoA hydratase-related protein [Simiduia curdlanivorans]|uniref:Enoyl-CoA hydratase/isomerase family protein n=1 Tax=Simiduia curdlanivorans TaxID=1492769 RepID=A0ABV8V9V6_9GAMM|nr:enoyl-CoA hydratase-related protein [Simiduia curdlanivorans]MDN3639652.1 enoyl-CoA hydratase-related protein [Simiduia curdlanivorans]